MSSSTPLSFLARSRRAFALSTLLAPLATLFGQSNEYRGLWVGQVTLNYVNEVSIPLDEDNIFVAPDPNLPTPTADQAHLRLILHVNGAGQVSLLKDVAVLNRNASALETFLDGTQVVDLGEEGATLDPVDITVQSENDISLVTDPALYSEFSAQAAVRFASAVFDFGDSRATEAVHQVIDAAAELAGESVNTTTETLSTDSGRAAAIAAAKAAVLDALDPRNAQDIVDHADVASAFDAFLKAEMRPGDVDDIAISLDPLMTAMDARTAAEVLRDRSFYGDSRGVSMVDAVVATVIATSGDEEAKKQAAQNMAAAFADVAGPFPGSETETGDTYQRFLAGKVFGDMIIAAAEAAAAESFDGVKLVASIMASPEDLIETGEAHDLNPLEPVSFTALPGESLPSELTAGVEYFVLEDGLTTTTFKISMSPAGAPVAFAGPLPGNMIEVRRRDRSRVETAVTSAGIPEVSAASIEANLRKVAPYRDTRGVEAIDQVLDAIIDAALAEAATAESEAAIRSTAEFAGRLELADGVKRYPRSAQDPTKDYTAFVVSETFLGSAEVAAQAAAEAAVSERINNGLWLPASLESAAAVGATEALRSVLLAAARAVRSELPLAGQFAPGAGDARLTWDIAQGDLPDLDPAGALVGTIMMPANHPTNPFRHFRHPDHAIGFDVTRDIRLDFDGESTDPLAPVGYGVDRITGTYREEISGLHKPLGPDPVNNPIGLKVEGRFELNRVSLIDTLNAR